MIPDPGEESGCALYRVHVREFPKRVRRASAQKRVRELIDPGLGHLTPFERPHRRRLGGGNQAGVGRALDGRADLILIRVMDAHVFGNPRGGHGRLRCDAGTVFELIPLTNIHAEGNSLLFEFLRCRQICG